MSKSEASPGLRCFVLRVFLTLGCYLTIKKYMFFWFQLLRKSGGSAGIFVLFGWISDFGRGHLLHFYSFHFVVGAAVALLFMGLIEG